MCLLSARFVFSSFTIAYFIGVFMVNNDDVDDFGSDSDNEENPAESAEKARAFLKQKKQEPSNKQSWK